MNYTNHLMKLTYDYEDIENRERIYAKIREKTKIEFGLIDKNKISYCNNEEIQKLNDDGFCHLGHLKLDICEYLIDKFYASNSSKSEVYKKNIEMRDLCKDSIVLQVFTKSRIIRQVESYLGVMPTIQSISSWQNIGGEKISRENEMYWHMDHHGHKFIKVFFYLTRVKYGYGHHQYVKRTHKQGDFDRELNQRSELCHLRKEVIEKRRLRGNYKIEDDALWPIADRIENVIGEAGAGFMEDTRGLHRGTILPTDERRIVIQALMLPFDSGKDVNIPKVMKRKLYNQIKKENQYTDQEMSKLLHNLKIIDDY